MNGMNIPDNCLIQIRSGQEEKRMEQGHHVYVRPCSNTRVSFSTPTCWVAHFLKIQTVSSQIESGKRKYDLHPRSLT